MWQPHWPSIRQIDNLIPNPHPANLLLSPEIQRLPVCRRETELKLQMPGKFPAHFQSGMSVWWVIKLYQEGIKSLKHLAQACKNMFQKSYCGLCQPQPVSASSPALRLSWDFLPQSHGLSQSFEKSLSCKLVFSLSFKWVAISGSNYSYHGYTSS